MNQNPIPEGAKLDAGASAGLDLVNAELSPKAKKFLRRCLVSAKNDVLSDIDQLFKENEKYFELNVKIHGMKDEVIKGAIIKFYMDFCAKVVSSLAQERAEKNADLSAKTDIQEKSESSEQLH